MSVVETTIFHALRKISPWLANHFIWWRIAHLTYWHYGRGVYVRAARRRWWAASLRVKCWILVEDIFARFGNLQDHGDDGITEAVGKIGPLHLLVYRGHYDGHDTLFLGNRILRSHDFYRYEED